MNLTKDSGRRQDKEIYEQNIRVRIVRNEMTS